MWGAYANSSPVYAAIKFYRFPLEVNMVFFSEPRELGIDNNFYPKNNATKIVMISVLGEVRCAG